ncbi:unnamed protein product [Blepharisma stoltei]|uniref:Ubiquinol-cytochrome C reductase hinge domain-containing protein n=1 Tax=Blepharisma stoltei TaxID=1481888 RepID=A0AAU9K889_9CILI|nr:unnamed protein product [Blepharisma stoltei]
MADLSEDQLHHKVLETLQKGEDPKPFVLEWCKPKCLDYKAMVERCEAALKIIKGVDSEKKCIFRFRQWVECVENCAQPKIFYHLKDAHNRGRLDPFFDKVWMLRWALLPLYPILPILLGMKRVNVLEGQPIE